MRFPGFIVVLVAGLFLSAIAAHADTINTLELLGTYDYNSQVYTASGTITINATTGVVEAIDLSYGDLDTADLGAGMLYVFSGTAASPFVDVQESWEGPDSSGAPLINLLLPVATLVGYDGGNICSLANPCVGDEGDEYSSVSFELTSGNFIDGSLSLTPEPSSLALVVTGALGIAGVMRRKLFRA